MLQETSLQQKLKLEAQAVELEALARAEKAGRAEAEGLRAALAGAEVVRKMLLSLEEELAKAVSALRVPAESHESSRAGLAALSLLSSCLALQGPRVSSC